MKKLIFVIVIISGILTSCRNAEWEFPDYDYTAVYFAYQTPVRTIVLGEDIYDTTLDNEHKCQILATMGGVYENKNEVEISFRVDNTLCDGVTNVVPMPANYYSLSSDNSMIIKSGAIMGGVVVQLTDAFFADPLSTKTTYVIPLQMTNVKNADKIITGTPTVPDPNRLIAADWDAVPKDYILYAVKYINPWDAVYVRRGRDNISRNDTARTEIRHQKYVEKDEVCKLNTISLSKLEYPMDYRLEKLSGAGLDLDMKVVLTFDANQKFAVSPIDAYQLNDTIQVYNITASGQGAFVKNGEVKSWGNKDRDAMYMNYEVGYELEIFYKKLGVTEYQQMHYSTVDTLVFRDRAIKPETFKPVLN